MKFSTRFLILCLVAIAYSTLAQMPGSSRVPAPIPSRSAGNSSVPAGVRRAGTTAPANTPTATARPAAASNASRGAKTVTQPDGKGSLPVVPYDESPNALNFQDASADLVIMEYALRTKRTVLKAPNIPAVNITLRSTPESPLDDEQYLAAIEQILNLNNIALIPIGDKFLKVVLASEIAKNGNKTEFAADDEEASIPAKDFHGQFVSQMIKLKYIDVAEAQTVVNGLVRQGSQIQTFERTNEILVTDSADNVNKIVEILKYIDKPIIAREESHIRKIKFAKAEDIKERLREIVDEIQKEENGTKKNSTVAQEKTTGSPGTQRRPLPSGVTFRNNNNNDREDRGLTTETINSLVDDAAKGILRGKVAIIADERTNLLVIFTRPENMVFFDKIIEELDQPTAPEFMAEVIRLEHAVADDLANLLNELIGKQKSSDNDAKPGVRDHRAENNSAERHPPANRNIVSSDTRTRVGQLDSENISILADERTNALLVMASASDMVSLKSIIKQMDIQLSQVVIETVIISISFTDSQETGMDWVQRAMLSGSTTSDNGPKFAFATAGGGGATKPRLATTLTDTKGLADSVSGGANAWFTIFDLNMDLVLTAVENDSRSKLMSSPRITTMDNKEATLEATKRIYWKGDSTNYENYSTQNTKNEDVGIKLTVTPRINKNGYITLTIKQEIQDADGYTTIGDSQYPNLTTRTMGADVAVQSGETVILGGLAQNSTSHSQQKVPILGSIPLIGYFFRYDKQIAERTEIIVFLTPRVLDTPEQMEDDARRIRSGLDTDGVWDASWSGSRLADPIKESKAKELTERDKDTIAPARYPQTGYLTPNNKRKALDTTDAGTARIANAIDKARIEDSTPFIHYSDVDSARIQAAIEAENQQSEYSDEPPAPSAAERVEQASFSYSEETITQKPEEPSTTIPEPDASKDVEVKEEQTAPTPVAKVSLDVKNPWFEKGLSVGK